MGDLLHGLDGDGGEAWVEDVEAEFDDGAGVDLAAAVQRHQLLVDEFEHAFGPVQIQGADVEGDVVVKGAAHFFAVGDDGFAGAHDAGAGEGGHELLNEAGGEADAPGDGEEEPVEVGLAA